MESPQPLVLAKRSNLRNIVNFIKEHWSDYLFLFIVAGAIDGIDQWTKTLVRNNVPLGTDWLPNGLAWLEPYARIRYWYNSGAAFGIFQNGNIVFTILAFLVILLIIYYFPRTERVDWWLRVAMILQLAGAAGNLIDRLARGHVTDFISVGNFAIFNVADASISVGVVVLLLGVWLKERTEKKKATMASQEVDEGQEQAKQGTIAKEEDEARSG
jgi:signal peptidase II